jgi:hypothetical protein
MLCFEIYLFLTLFAIVYYFLASVEIFSNCLSKWEKFEIFF